MKKELRRIEETYAFQQCQSCFQWTLRSTKWKTIPTARQCAGWQLFK